MKRFLIVLVALGALPLDLSTAAAEKKKLLDPNDIEFTLEQLGCHPIHPYQAAHLRFTVRNKSKNRLGPVVNLDDGVAFTVRGPNDDGYRDYSGTPLIFDKDKPSATTTRERLNSTIPLYLETGDKTSVSLAFAAAWFNKEGRLPIDKGIATFDQPGKYLLKCKCPMSPKLEKVIEIKVQAPQGADKAVYEMLKADRALASAMMRPVDAFAEPIGLKLSKIINDYPESTYTPYARFALVRGYVKGIGRPHASIRVGRAICADELDKAAKHQFDSEKMVPIRNEFPFRVYALLLLAGMDRNDRHWCLGDLHTDHYDSPVWLETFAGMFAGAYAKEVEWMVQKRLPRDEAPVAEREAFLAEVWTKYRKR